MSCECGKCQDCELHSAIYAASEIFELGMSYLPCRVVLRNYPSNGWVVHIQYFRKDDYHFSYGDYSNTCEEALKRFWERTWEYREKYPTK